MPHSRERERVSIVLFYGFVLLLAYLVFLVVQPFLSPLLWASVLAVCFHPWYRRLRKRFSPSGSALATTLIVTVIIIVPVVILLSTLVREAAVSLPDFQTVVQTGPAGIQHFWEGLQRRIPLPSPTAVMNLITDGVRNLAAVIASQTGNIVANIAVSFLNLIITLFVLFFFLRDAEILGRAVRKLLPFEEAQREQLISQALELIRASVVTGLAVAATQGFIGGVTFALLGIPSPAFWGVTMAFCSLIPVVGASIVWLPAALFLMITGEMTRGLILIAVCGGVVSSVDNFLRPMLLSGRTEMNGLVLLISLLGGVAAFGFVGLVLGPVVFATATSLLDTYRSPAAPTID
jgi:predicted PurR-regulated permease PerM